MDFESKIFVKEDAPQLLREFLAKDSWQPEEIVMSGVTDPYQPAERHFQLSRRCLEVALEARQPIGLITKNALILRDLDLLAELARDRLVSVMLSITSLSDEIKRTLEPRTASPQARLRVIGALAQAGVPVGVMVAPVIPAITDHELEAILRAAREAGASCASYVLLRLPHEVKILFREWLQQHYPERAKHVMSLINQARGGKDYDSQFGVRMRGTGPYAELLRTRFEVAVRKLGFADARGRHDLRTDLFRGPSAVSQLTLGF